MQLTKAILTTNKKQLDLLIDKYKLLKLNVDGIDIFEGSRISDEKEEEKIILIFSGTGQNFIETNLKYLFENYDIYKLINIGIAESISGFDTQVGDIFIPNTFLSLEEDTPIFLNYAVGENYNLTKFGLILNGICLTSETKDLGSEFIADIIDNEAYHILKTVQNEDKLDKCAVIKTIVDEKDNNIAIKNSVQILDFIL